MAESPTPASEVPQESRVRRLWGAVGRLLRARELRRLRWILLIGLTARIVLAPLTSWATDTPGFVLSCVSFLYSGNPYLSTTLYNPPLGPFLATPLIAIPALLYGPHALLPAVATIAPVTVATGVDLSVVPIPAALLAWKLPLILSDLGVAILLFWTGRRYQLPVSAEWITAVWFLNPLVIWASSVHGEVDTLAAFFVLLALVAFLRNQWMTAGLAIGLAIFSKGYPLVLLPLAVAVTLTLPRLGVVARSGRLKEVGLWAAGLGASALPFLFILGPTLATLLGKAATPSFGGISLLAIFNPASPKGSGWYFHFATDRTYAGWILDGFRGLAIAGVLAGIPLVAWNFLRRPSSPEAQLRVLALAMLLAIDGAILADAVPEPENLVGLLPLLLLTFPSDRRRWAAALVVVLTASGLVLYWTFLTPFAMFYPLATQLGPGYVGWINRIAVDFLQTPGLRGSLWLASGVMGGAALLAVWVWSVVRLVPRDIRERIRGVWSRDVGPAIVTES